MLKIEKTVKFYYFFICWCGLCFLVCFYLSIFFNSLLLQNSINYNYEIYQNMLSLYKITWHILYLYKSYFNLVSFLFGFSSCKTCFFLPLHTIHRYFNLKLLIKYYLIKSAGHLLALNYFKTLYFPTKCFEQSNKVVYKVI